MEYIPISWEVFTPHALKKHYLYHKKDTPKRTIAQDYICLDTETSSNINIEQMEVPTELLDRIKGRRLRVPDYVKKELAWGDIRKPLTRAGVKLSNTGSTVSELYDEFHYMLPDAVNEADQLYYLTQRIIYETEQKHKKRAAEFFVLPARFLTSYSIWYAA